MTSEDGPAKVVEGYDVATKLRPPARLHVISVGQIAALVFRVRLPVRLKVRIAYDNGWFGLSFSACY